jgi:hypothetical protein
MSRRRTAALLALALLLARAVLPHLRSAPLAAGVPLASAPPASTAAPFAAAAPPFAAAAPPAPGVPLVPAGSLPPGLPPTASAPRTPPAPDAGAVRAALAALDRARAAAYADPLTGDPDAWALRSCACRAEDVRRLRDLARAGLALRGHAVTVTGLTVLAARAGPSGTFRVDVLVTDRVSAYTAVDRAGRVVRRWPSTGPRRWRLGLVRAAGRWRYAAVARAP